MTIKEYIKIKAVEQDLEVQVVMNMMNMYLSEDQIVDLIDILLPAKSLDKEEESGEN